MNYGALIQNRKSVRAFQSQMVSADVSSKIAAFYSDEAHRLLPQIKTELRFFANTVKEALEGAAGYQKFMIGAPGYMVLLSEDVPHAAENAGFLMEDIILKLTDMDLDSCWITFADSDEIKKALDLDSDLKVAAIVAYGYGVKETRRLRVNAKSMSNVSVAEVNRYYAPKLSVGEIVSHNIWDCKDNMFEELDFYDDSLWQAFYAATLAPSFLNRQPYGFILAGGKVVLVKKPDAHTDDWSAGLNLGIVMLHFAGILSYWSGECSWHMDADPAGLELPEGHEAAAWCGI